MDQDENLMARVRLKELTGLLIPQLFIWSIVFQWLARTNAWVQLATYMLLGLVLITGMMKIGVSGKAITIPQPVIPLILYIVYRAITLSFTSVFRISLSELLLTLLLFMIFIYFINRLETFRDSDKWEFALIVVGGFFSLLNLMMIATRIVEWWGLRSRLGVDLPFHFRLSGGFLHHPNVEAAFINLLIPVVVGKILLSKRSAGKVLLGTLAGIFLLSLYFSSSRGGWLSGVIGIAITILLTIFAYARKKEIHLRSILLRMSQPLALASGLTFLAAAGSGVYLILHLINSTGRPALWPSRARPWTHAWNLFMESPLFGHGTGSTQFLIALDKTIPPEPYYVHTHNLFLQVGTETGILGVAILLWFLVTGSKFFYSTFVNSNYEGRLRLAAISGSISTVLIHHLVDYFFGSPIYSVTVLFLAASVYLISSLQNQPVKSFKINANLVSIPALAVVLATIYTHAPIAQFRAINAFLSEPSAERSRDLCDLAGRHRGLPFLQFACGRAMAEVGYLTQDRSSLTIAADAFEAGLAIDPYWPLHAANLAAIQWEAGLEEQALMSMKTALESAPNSPGLNINYALMLEDYGDLESAQEHFAIALANDVSLLETKMMKTSTFDVSNFTSRDVRESESKTDYHADLGWYYVLSNQIEAAENEFEQVVDTAPGHASARTGMGMIEYLRGDFDIAKRDLEIALYSNGNEQLAHYLTAKIALAENNRELWSFHIERLIATLRNQNLSREYYNVVYEEHYISPDNVPQLRMIFLREDVITDLYAYSRSLQIEDPERAQAYLALISSWDPDGEEQ